MRRADYDTRRHPVSRLIVRSVAVIAVLVVVLGGLGLWTVQRSFPVTDGEIRLDVLEAPVTVTRDDAGIPQLEADSAVDLFAAQGFVHAQDRFWEMDFRRHVTSGRLAEMFGESQIGTDAFVRTLGWRAVAEQEVAALDDVSRSYYEAYAAGVNAYLESRSGADLSLEYAVLGLQNPEYSPEPWTPADSVAWLKAMAWDLRSNLETEIERALLTTVLEPDRLAELFPAYPYDEHPTITAGPVAGADPAQLSATSTAVDEATEGDGESDGDAAGGESSGSLADEGTVAALEDVRTALRGLPELLGKAGTDIGSNAWVVSGEHTESGQPLLANDPHLGPSLPSIWYQMGLRCSTVSEACPFDVAGFSFSGLPGIIIGHNDRIAWGFTNLGPDVADLYIERVAGDESELDGAMRPLDIRTETISVAGGDDVEVRVRSTSRGPIVSDVSGQIGAIATDYREVSGEPEREYAVSLQWTALTPGRTPTAIFALNAARDWDAFRAAAERFEVPSQNLLYADVDGNIGYQAPGVIPIRTGSDGTRPQAGWTSRTGWVGTVPFAELPSVFNPPSGYIVTANNAVAPNREGPFLTADWDAGYRADRIDRLVRGLVDREEPVTAADMSAVQADDHNAIAERLVPLILELEPSGAVSDAQDLLSEWDRHDDAASPSSAFFNVFWKTLLDETFRSRLPDDLPPGGGSRWFLVVDRLVEQPSSPWWRDEADEVDGLDDALERSVRLAWEESERLMGADTAQWRWGDLHELELRNATFGSSGIAPIEWLFNRGPWATSGGSSEVNAIGWDLANGYAVDWVPSMRQVVDLADLDESTWINLAGSSGHAFHPHYTDQTEAWAANETRSWPFSRSATDEAAVDRLVLTP